MRVATIPNATPIMPVKMKIMAKRITINMRDIKPYLFPIFPIPFADHFPKNIVMKNESKDAIATVKRMSRKDEGGNFVLNQTGMLSI